MPYKRRNQKPSKNLRKMVSKMIQGDKELKRVSGSTTSFGSSTTGATIALCDISAGDGSNNREGHDVFLQTVHYEYGFVAGDAYNYVRMIMYSKRDESGLDLAIAYNEIPDFDKYVIYNDDLILTTTNHPMKVKRSHKFRGKGKKVLFDDTTATSQVSGEVKIYLVSDSGTVAHPTVDGFFVTWFHE